jgi:REP element-mobilizing transposase RayT
MVLSKNRREDLYKYISGVLENKKCHLYRIGGIEDHIHILTHLNPSISLSDLVKDIKMSSTEFIKAKKLFLNFNGWQNGYGAFTYSIKQKDILIEYVKNQEEHHNTKNFREEYVELLIENGVEYNEKYVL